ncbi:MAG: DUF4214 domain-containing protein, partial [Proteobacteria bacterium]
MKNLKRSAFLVLAALTVSPVLPSMAFAESSADSLELQGFTARKSTKQLINLIYLGALYRSAEPAGLKAWGDLLKARGSNGLYDVGYGIGSSEEFQANINSRGAEAVVKHLYATFFNREADAEGLGQWVALIEQGRPGEALAGIVS